MPKHPFGMTGLWENLGRMMKRDARAKLLFCQSKPSVGPRGEGWSNEAL